MGLSEEECGLLLRITCAVERIRDEQPDMRDYFAGLAMQGMLAGGESKGKEGADRELLVLRAYATADAMLAARDAKGPVTP